VTAADITVSLGEATVTLGTLDDGVVVPGSESDLNGASVIMGNNQTLRLVNSDQADGLDISGGTNTTLVFLFDDTGLPAVGNVGTIDASGYDVDFLRALNTFVDGRDVENLVVNLDSSVTLVVYHSPEELGFVSPTHRVVVIETGVTVPDFIVFNDWQDNVEVRTLSLTMEGDAHINGNLRLTTVPKDPGLVPQYFQTLTINSIGAEGNSITGDITADTIGVGPSIQNNLLNVVINASQDFEVGGAIVFTSVDDADYPDATLTITGTADVTVEQLDVDDAEVETLTIANNGTGTFTATGASPAFFGATIEELVLTGAGDMVFGSNPAVTTETGRQRRQPVPHRRLRHVRRPRSGQGHQRRLRGLHVHRRHGRHQDDPDERHAGQHGGYPDDGRRHRRLDPRLQ